MLNQSLQHVNGHMELDKNVERSNHSTVSKKYFVSGEYLKLVPYIVTLLITRRLNPEKIYILHNTTQVIYRYYFYQYYQIN